MEYKGQSPSNTDRVSQPHPRPPVRMGEGKQIMIERDGNKKVWIAAIIAVVVVGLGALGWWGVTSMSSADGIKKGQYQAVFLSNGQVYFCKLSNASATYIDCTDIYYLQVQQSVQPADKNAQTPQVSLAKLGSELHGPEDQMKINRDQVLFWENLKDNSKVVEAIKKNQQAK
jgi:hypothetical protein